MLYRKFGKRLFDIVMSLIALILLLPLMLVIAVLIRIKLGSPVIFKQQRPGLNEMIFTLHKFRTMTNERDEYGELLSDSVRLTKFGKWLRSTSIDELPELWDILIGKMSIVGPRPQLIKDLIFMSEFQRLRHIAKPGLTGLAQINGRNSINWEDKFKYDLMYIENITLITDIKIISITFAKVFSRSGINQSDFTTAEDLGDYLLRLGQIDEQEFSERLAKL